MTLTQVMNPMNNKPVKIQVAELNDGIAGRTKDSTLDEMTVYMDPLVPEAMYRSLVVHEYTELLYMLKGDDYNTAHRHATKNEKTCAEKHGADWAAYNRNYIKLLRRVERRGGTNPPDLFEGEEGEKPTEKGADIADIVAPGGQASRRHDIKVVTECRTSDGKLTNCGNMPQVDKAVSPPDKNGRCHDEQGHLASCGTGGKETTQPAPRRNSDLPPWMQEKPKPKPPEKPTSTVPDASQNTMRYGKMPNGPKNTWVPDKSGKYPYPDYKQARMDLKPLVGKKVKVHYLTEKIGGPSFTDKSTPSRCIKNITVEGVEQPIDHIWAQEGRKELLDAKQGQWQTAVGTVTAYDKGKPGEPRKMDYSVQFFEDIKNVDKMVRDENGRCHDDQGHLTSCGDATAEPSGDKPGAPKDQPAPGKTPAKPAEDFDENDVPMPDEEPKAEKLSSEESKAVRIYQGADYAFINSWLRNPGNGGNKEDGKHYLGMADQIEHAINKQPPLKGEEIVYRGIRTDKNMMKNLVVGAVVEDPAFMSTTTDRMIAKNFGNTVFTIRVPKGTRALKMTDILDTTSSRAEAEMLLQRGTKIQITHVRKETGGFLGMGAKTYIEAKVIQ